ncbi:MAG: DNA polymerase III subunit delta [Bacteroidales bacterium]|nr:DNA polymerase III subunit delta [Bacteroidales bacterium]
MTYEQIISDLENKIYHTVYFLTGEEPYYIDKITDYIEKSVLTESERTFNQTILYGRDTDIGTVINTAKRYSMMSNHQVVVLKEAQSIKQIDTLIHYISNPLKSTILVINYKYKNIDKRTKFFKALKQDTVFFESKKLYDDKIPGWIRQYLDKRDIEIDPGIGMILTDFLGNDLSKIVNELEKLIIVLPKGNNRITAEIVERNIGISKDFNNFELHKALGKKEIVKSNRIINYFGKNPKDNPITLTLSSLYFYFSKVLTYHFVKDKSQSNLASKLKVAPYFVQEYKVAASNYSPAKLSSIISLLRKYDLKSKGIGNISMSEGDMLKELIYMILH